MYIYIYRCIYEYMIPIDNLFKSPQPPPPRSTELRGYSRIVAALEASHFLKLHDDMRVSQKAGTLGTPGDI